MPSVPALLVPSAVARCVLIAGGDATQAEILRCRLVREGHAVSVCAILRDAPARTREAPVHLVVFDLDVLPLETGLNILGRLVAADGPLLLAVSRRPEVDVAGQALHAGADAFLNAGAGPEALSTQVLKLLRVQRVPLSDAGWQPIATGCRLHEPSRRVVGPRVDCVLSCLQHKLLVHFLHNEGRLLEREAPLTAVWGLDAPDQQEVRQFVFQLRHIIEADPEHPRHLLTVRGVGYRYQGPCRDDVPPG